MGVNKYNKEGYYDSTAYEAMTGIVREDKKKGYRPLVFICSPLAGDIEGNLENVRRYSKFAVREGAIPFAPHLLYPQILDEEDKSQRNLGIFFGLVVMGKCDQLWVFGDHISSGMNVEIMKAKKRGMPIRYFSSQCEEMRP